MNRRSYFVAPLIVGLLGAFGPVAQAEDNPPVVVTVGPTDELAATLLAADVEPCRDTTAGQQYYDKDTNTVPVFTLSVTVHYCFNYSGFSVWEADWKFSPTTPLYRVEHFAAWGSQCRPDNRCSVGGYHVGVEAVFCAATVTCDESRTRYPYVTLTIDNSGVHVESGECDWLC